MEVDTALDPLVDSITQNDDGTFSYSTHDSTADTSVRVVQGSTSITLDTTDASLSTDATKITLEGIVQTDRTGGDILEPTDTIRAGLNDLNTQIVGVDSELDTLANRVTNLQGSDIGLNDIHFPASPRCARCAR